MPQWLAVLGCVYMQMGMRDVLWRSQRVLIAKYPLVFIIRIIGKRVAIDAVLYDYSAGLDIHALTKVQPARGVELERTDATVLEAGNKSGCLDTLDNSKPAICDDSVADSVQIIDVRLKYPTVAAYRQVSTAFRYRLLPSS